MRRNANQQDVAKAAGVSVSTVSRALSNARGISAELKAQIQHLADELGYQKRGKPDGVTRLLRVYVATSAATGGLASFYSAVVDGMNHAASDAGLTLEVRLLHEDGLTLDRLKRDSEGQPAGATLMVGLDASQEVFAWFGRDNPLILVNTFDDLMRFDCVAPNNYFGAYWATQRLLRAGHRSIWHVRDQKRWTTLQRQRGYMAAIDDWEGAGGGLIDIHVDAELALAKAIKDRQAGRTDWTALFCAHDMAAIQVIHLLEVAGIHVPDDVAVMGFDNLPAASMMTPRLSTMRVDCEAIGREAIALFLRRISFPDASPIQVECAVEPIEGGTIMQIA